LHAEVKKLYGVVDGDMDKHMAVEHANAMCGALFGRNSFADNNRHAKVAKSAESQSSGN